MGRNFEAEEDIRLYIYQNVVYNHDDNDGQMIFGDLGGLKLPDICLTSEEKPQKNLTKETCPDRGSNPGPLRDRRACYRLSLSGGQNIYFLNQHFLRIYSTSSFSINCRKNKKLFRTQQKTLVGAVNMENCFISSTVN